MLFKKKLIASPATSKWTVALGSLHLSYLLVSIVTLKNSGTFSLWISSDPTDGMTIQHQRFRTTNPVDDISQCKLEGCFDSIKENRGGDLLRLIQRRHPAVHAGRVYN